MEGKPPSTADHVAKSLGMAMRLNADELKFDPLFAQPRSEAKERQKEERRKAEEEKREKQAAAAAEAPASDDLPESLQALVDLVGTQLQDKLGLPATSTEGRETVSRDERAQLMLPGRERRRAADPRNPRSARRKHAHPPP